MKPTTPDALDYLIAAAWAAGRAIVKELLIPLLALGITLATLNRESTLPRLPKVATTPSAPLALPPATEEPMPKLSELPVRELRVLARTAGHKGLARNGRKAELLAVLEG